MGCSDGMEPDEDTSQTKKLNDEFVEFMRKRSETEAPRYTARLKTYVDIKRKRDRATAARRHAEGTLDKAALAAGKKPADEQKDRGLDINDHTGGDKEKTNRRRSGDKLGVRGARSCSRSRSGEPADRCGRRRRSRRRRRRRSCCRRRSCRRRRRRRRSCRRRRRRRSCRRRRRRSCRRRRRRSCRRRRRRRSCRRRR